MGEGSGVEGSRVELAENRIVLSQLYFTLLYSPSLSLNLNRPLILNTCEESV